MNLFSYLLIIMLGLYVLYEFKKMIDKTDVVWVKLFLGIFTIIHFVVAFIFATYLYDMSIINDPKDFYETAVEANSWSELFGVGHAFMSFVIYPFVKLNIGIQPLFYLFATISYKAFVYCFELIGVSKIHTTNKLLLLFFLMPTLHVWTAFLGKEPLLLLLMILLLKNITEVVFHWKVGLILLLIFLIRPHVCFVLVGSIAIQQLLSKQLSKKEYFYISVSFIIAICLLLPVTMRYFLNIEILNIENIILYYDHFISEISNKGGSAISVQETTVFTRIFYLLWMPFPFLYEIKNSLQWLVAIENVYYMVVTLWLIYFFILKKEKTEKNKAGLNFSLLAGSLLMLLFASYLYNLGLGNRMKIMFLPYLFYFLIVKTQKVESIKKDFNDA